MKRYEVGRDNIRKCWIVWEVEGSLKTEVFKSHLKKDCNAKKEKLEAKKKRGTKKL